MGVDFSFPHAGFISRARRLAAILFPLALGGCAPTDPVYLWMVGLAGGTPSAAPVGVQTYENVSAPLAEGCPAFLFSGSAIPVTVTVTDTLDTAFGADVGAFGTTGYILVLPILIGTGETDVSFTIDDSTDTIDGTIDGAVPLLGVATPFTAQILDVTQFETSFSIDVLFQRQGVTPDISAALDFEDALPPPLHGWQPISPDPGAQQDSSVQCGSSTGGGSFNLTMNATDTAGWYLDLTGLVDVDQDWIFEADLRRTDIGPTGTNDVGIERIGAGTGSLLVLGLPQSADGQYHNLRMEMDHAANEVRHYVDNVLVATVPPYSDLNAVIPSSNAIDIIFGNSGISAQVEIDNVSFRASGEVPALGPLGIVACGLLLLAAGARVLATRRA